MKEYELLGLPGTIGSVDVTHVILDKCPTEFTNLASGKEGKPSLAFQVVVSHGRRILNVNNAEFGSYNDKTISRIDPFVKDIMNGVKYNDVKYNMYTSDGVSHEVNGIHLICDGGYLKLPSMIDPITFRTDMKDVFWSEWVESCRKDVECTFGIMKNRFRILKNPLQYHSFKDIENIFIACCMLHNIILQVDNLEAWERDVDWEFNDPDYGMKQGFYYELNCIFYSQMFLQFI
jgi:hypothetical protein